MSTLYINRGEKERRKWEYGEKQGEIRDGGGNLVAKTKRIVNAFLMTLHIKKVS